MRHMAASGALYATPKDVLLGLTDQQFKAMSEAKWSVMVGSLSMGTRDKNGQSPDYRRIQSASPQPYIDSIQTYAKLFSGATGVPLKFFCCNQKRQPKRLFVQDTKNNFHCHTQYPKCNPQD